MARFTDVFEDVTKQGTKIPTNRYLEKGAHPIIDQGQSEIAGYTNETDGLFTNVPAIIFGDHTRIIKYVDTPCFLGADGVKLLKAKAPKANYKYLYYALCNADIPNTGYNRHFKWLKEIEIPEYLEKEQNEIADQLEQIDFVISLRKQQLAKLDELVKARFVEMFGLPVSNTMNWETEKMQSIAPSQNYLGEMPDEVWLLNLDMIESQTGRIIDYLIVPKDEVGNSTCVFDDSTVLYSKLRPYLNKVVIPNRCGYATSELVPLKPNSFKLNREYLAYMLRSDDFVTMISEKVAGAKMPRVSMNDFRNFEVPIPPIELQNEFAAFVKQIDKSKLAVQQSLEKLETLKKALMQKYFG